MGTLIAPKRRTPRTPKCTGSPMRDQLTLDRSSPPETYPFSLAFRSGQSTTNEELTLRPEYIPHRCGRPKSCCEAS